MPRRDSDIMFLGRGHSLINVDNDEVDLTGRRMKTNRETINFKSRYDSACSLISY